MAAFTYNFYSNENYISQYRSYLQSQDFVNQIDTSIRETGQMNAAIITIQSREVQNTINHSCGKITDAIHSASRAICSTLENGFTDINDNLYGIKDEIIGLSNLVGHGFSLVVEGQKITHNYLGKIQNLLRIPDSQKQRVYHIEEGMKYFQNAIRESPDSDFYTDALEEFKKSEDIEKKDYFSLYHIGLIHLSSTKHLEPSIAESYFRNAARYYLAEALISGTNFSNSLLNSNNEFLLEAAEAYLFAAKACYIQQKFADAASLALEAWKTFPELVKAGFEQAKYLAANGDAKLAATVLEKVIRTNRFLSREVSSDSDLISKQEIIVLLGNLKIEAVNEARNKFRVCSEIIIPNSIAKDYLKSIEKLIQLNAFLESKEAADMLVESKKWTIAQGANISPQGQLLAKISSLDFTGSVMDFVKFESERVLFLPKVINLIHIEELEKQKQPLQSEIKNLQSQVDSNNSELSKNWKRWFIAFIMVFLATLKGISMSVAFSFIVFICQIIMYLGDPIVAAWLVILIYSNISIAIKNGRLKSTISLRKSNILRLNEAIKKLE